MHKTALVAPFQQFVDSQRPNEGTGHTHTFTFIVGSFHLTL